jgi:hemerythrin
MSHIISKEIKMALFKWYKIYSVNNNELDEQHKTFLSIFNKLYGNCLHRENAYCIDTIIEELIAYSYHHFSVEEKYMRNIGYKEINKHISEHTEFTQKTFQLQQSVDKNVPWDSKKVIVYLRNWFINHIIFEDKKYALNKQGVSTWQQYLN